VLKLALVGPLPTAPPPSPDAGLDGPEIGTMH
jgi:hypothetical protein